MNSARLSQVRVLLETLGVRPSKALGQNFLVDRNILDIMMRAARLDSQDAVIEVGPGLGVLTERLLDACDSVTAVEKDARLAAYLRNRFATDSRLRLMQADMLDLDMNALRGGQADRPKRLTRMVSNLPYCAGTRILMNWVVSEPAPQGATVTLQREVAQRLAADPGTRTYGMISVWARIQYDVRVVKQVPASCFWPKPEVVSAIVDLRMRREGALEPDTVRQVCALTRQAFQQRRKQLAVALSRTPGLDRDDCMAALRAAGAGDKDRAENLEPDQWVALARALG